MKKVESKYLQPQLPHLWLQEEYKKRRSKNAHFSLRAFARLLQISPGRLSEFLSNKRNITIKAAIKIVDRLQFDPVQRAEFLKCLSVRKSDDINTQEQNFLQLSQDAFSVISDWYHFAILSLIETDAFKNDPKWIAKSLGISAVEANSAIERLLRLELIERSGKAIKRTSNNLTTTHDVSSVAIRKAHAQILQKAIEALDLPVETRDVTSITMAIDIDKLPKAKTMIRSFRRRLCSFLESDKKNSVYHLNVQLVPVTGNERK